MAYNVFKTYKYERANVAGTQPVEYQLNFTNDFDITGWFYAKGIYDSETTEKYNYEIHHRITWDQTNKILKLYHTTDASDTGIVVYQNGNYVTYNYTSLSLFGVMQTDNQAGWQTLEAFFNYDVPVSGSVGHANAVKLPATMYQTTIRDADPNKVNPTQVNREGTYTFYFEISEEGMAYIPEEIEIYQEHSLYGGGENPIIVSFQVSNHNHNLEVELYFPDINWEYGARLTALSQEVFYLQNIKGYRCRMPDSYFPVYNQSRIAFNFKSYYGTYGTQPKDFVAQTFAKVNGKETIGYEDANGIVTPVYSGYQKSATTEDWQYDYIQIQVESNLTDENYLRWIETYTIRNVPELFVSKDYTEINNYMDGCTKAFYNPLWMLKNTQNFVFYANEGYEFNNSTITYLTNSLVDCQLDGTPSIEENGTKITIPLKITSGATYSSNVAKFSVIAVTSNYPIVLNLASGITLNPNITSVNKDNIYVSQLVLDDATHYDLSNVSILIGNADKTNYIYQDNVKLYNSYTKILTIRPQELDVLGTITITANKQVKTGPAISIQNQFCSVSPASPYGTLNYGETKTFTFTANSGKRFDFDDATPFRSEYCNMVVSPSTGRQKVVEVTISNPDYTSPTYFVDLYATASLLLTASVTRTGSNVTYSNNANSVNYDSSYTNVLTPATDYSIVGVAVTMDGVDITSTSWNSANSTITIAEVTGDITIDVSTRDISKPRLDTPTISASDNVITITSSQTSEIEKFEVYYQTTTKIGETTTNTFTVPLNDSTMGRKEYSVKAIAKSTSDYSNSVNSSYVYVDCYKFVHSVDEHITALYLVPVANASVEVSDWGSPVTSNTMYSAKSYMKAKVVCGSGYQIDVGNTEVTNCFLATSDVETGVMAFAMVFGYVNEVDFKSQEIPVATEYDITYSLSHCTATGQATTIEEGQTITITITADDNYSFPAGYNPEVVNADKVASTWEGQTQLRIRLSNATSDVSITASATQTNYSITNTEDAHITFVGEESVYAGSLYTASFTPDAQYEVKNYSFTMGGVAVSDPSYWMFVGDVLHFSGRVTGNVVFNVTSQQKGLTPLGLPNLSKTSANVLTFSQSDVSEQTHIDHYELYKKVDDSYVLVNNNAVSPYTIALSSANVGKFTYYVKAIGSTGYIDSGYSNGAEVNVSSIKATGTNVASMQYAVSDSRVYPQASAMTSDTYYYFTEKYAKIIVAYPSGKSFDEIDYDNCDIVSQGTTEFEFENCYNGDVEITASATPQEQVINTLRNVTTNNQATQVAQGSTYNATFTLNAGYDEFAYCDVWMGGVKQEITTEGATKRKVAIASVDGEIIINVKGKKSSQLERSIVLHPASDSSINVYPQTLFENIKDLSWLDKGGYVLVVIDGIEYKLTKYTD